MSKFKRIISLLLAVVSFCVLELANPLQTIAEELNQPPTAETAIWQEIEEPDSLPSSELQESPLVTVPSNPDEPQTELYILVYIFVILTDAKGNTSTYTYGDAESMLRLASLTGAGTGTVQYGYDEYGKLTQISRTSATYSFTYDSWNRSKAVKVGGITLSENQYDTYGRLSTTTDTYTYGNESWGDQLTAYNGQSIAYLGYTIEPHGLYRV